MAKYGKEDIHVIASDGSRVLKEKLSEYEKVLANMPKSEISDLPAKKIREKRKVMKPTDNSEVSKVSDDAVVINYIMLARIYDLLCVIGDSLGKGEDIMNLMNLHKEGQLMSPPPILATKDDSEE